jgi:hypothetical protein
VVWAYNDELKQNSNNVDQLLKDKDRRVLGRLKGLDSSFQLTISEGNEAEKIM